MKNRTDLTGKRYGRLTVINLDEVKTNLDKNYNTHWLCRCDCGNEKTIVGSSLNYGATTSCGCLFREKHTTHGLSNHYLYVTWVKMKERCYEYTFRPLNQILKTKENGRK